MALNKSRRQRPALSKARLRSRLGPGQFEGVPPFKDEPSDTAWSEVVTQVVVEFPDGTAHVIGSAFHVCQHLAITARHVVEEIIARFDVDREDGKNKEISSYAIRLYHLVGQKHYCIWQVVTAWPCVHTDVAFLHLAYFGASKDLSRYLTKSLPIRLLGPKVGEKVVGFGYRLSSMTTTRTDAGYHLDLQHKATVTSGVVVERHESYRDRLLLPFPVFRFDARFDGGMSGGPVVDEYGQVCGMLCQSMGEAVPTGYAAILWPMLKTAVSGNRKGQARNIMYNAVELVFGGQIYAVDVDQLDPFQFPGYRLTQPPRRPLRHSKP